MGETGQDLTPAEVAHELRVSIRTVQHWLKTGELRGYKAGFRQWRIRREDLDEFIRQRNQPSNEKE